VLRQTVVEALVLAGSGGLIGVLLAQVSLGILSGLLPADLPRLSQVGVDLRAVTVALVTVAGVCVTLSVLFAGRAAQLDLGERGGDGRDPGRRSRPSWLGGSLVGAQVAVTTVLLFAAVLLGRSLLELNGVDPGFRTSGLMSFRVSLPDDAYPAASDAIGFFDRLVPSLRGLPAVDAVQLTSAVPLGGSQRTTAVHAQTGEREEVRAGFQAVTGGYFELLGIPLRAGRLFVETDGPGAPEVAVVDETLAARLWPGESPIGRRMSRSGPDGPWIEVVGMVGAVRHRDLRRPASPTYYSSYRQRGWDTMNVVLSTSASPAAVIDLVRSRVAAIDPDQPVEAVTTLDDLLFASTASTRLQALLLGVFGGVALAVASLGIYAVVAHRVERRVPEIGIRIALGATRAAILRLVLRQGWAPVAVGIATGLGGALAAQGVLASLLFGVVPGDPVSLALVVGLLLVVALLATYVPARRAARLDPARALLAG
jgi:putative ABC transport system permease protein